MWVIYSGASGYQFATAKEKQLISTPYYLIKFLCDTTKKTAYCVCQDASVYPDRTQKFLITEKSNPTSGNGEVKLDYRGRSWRYFIYESSTVPVNETGLNEVDQGRVKVLQVSPTEPQKYTGYDSTLEQD
jgi:hypothetical protein